MLKITFEIEYYFQRILFLHITTARRQTLFTPFALIKESRTLLFFLCLVEQVSIDKHKRLKQRTFVFVIF